jgi:hypothetical protein
MPGETPQARGGRVPPRWRRPLEILAGLAVIACAIAVSGYVFGIVDRALLHPVMEPPGGLDVNVRNAALRASFVPPGPCGLVLVVEDGAFDPATASKSPTGPLVLHVTLRDEAGGILGRCDVDRRHMVLANYCEPHTAMILHLDVPSSALGVGSRHVVEVVVKEAENRGAPGKLFLHYMTTPRRRLLRALFGS